MRMARGMKVDEFVGFSPFGEVEPFETFPDRDSCIFLDCIRSNCYAIHRRSFRRVVFCDFSDSTVAN